MTLWLVVFGAGCLALIFAAFLNAACNYSDDLDDDHPAVTGEHEKDKK